MLPSQAFLVRPYFSSLTIVLFLACPLLANSSPKQCETSVESSPQESLIFSRSRKVAPADYQRILDLRQILHDQIFFPVISESKRLSNYAIEIAAPADRPNVLILVTPNGNYEAYITNTGATADTLYNSVATFDIVRNGKVGKQMIGYLNFEELWLNDPKFIAQHLPALQGRVRSIIGGDASLHAHIRDPSAPQNEASIPSMEQQRLIREMHKLREQYRIKYPSRSVPMVLLGPGGFGKTVIVGLYVRDCWDLDGRVGLTLFMVQSVDINESARQKISRDLGLDPASVWVYYGKHKQHQPPSSLDQIKLIITTRTGAQELVAEDKNGQSMLKQAAGYGTSSRRALTTIVDEAKEASTRDGEYQKFIDSLRGVYDEKTQTFTGGWLNERDQIVYMTAAALNSMHPGLLSQPRLGHGNIAAAFTTTAQVRALLDQITANPDRENEISMKFAIEQTRAAALQGHITPWAEVWKPNYIFDTEGNSVLNKVEKFEEPGTNGNLVTKRRPVVELFPIQGYAKDLIRIDTQDALREPLRGIIYVQGAKRAELFAEMLQEEFKRLEANFAPEQRRFTVRHYTSLSGSFDALSWMNDSKSVIVGADGTQHIRADYSTEENRHVNKIVVVDEMLGRGADIPALNTLVFALNIDQASPGAMEVLFQRILRATRRAPFKPNFIIIDSNGAAKSLLESSFKLRTIKVGEGAGGTRESIETVDPTIGNQDGRLGESLIATLIAGARGNPSEFGADVNMAEDFLIRRSPFELVSYPEGFELAKALLRWSEVMNYLDHARLHSDLKGREYITTMAKTGMSDMHGRYLSALKVVNELISQVADYTSHLDSGYFNTNDEARAYGEDELRRIRSEAARVASSPELTMFWSSAQAFLRNADPMKDQPVFMTLAREGMLSSNSHEAAQNLVQFYRDVINHHSPNGLASEYQYLGLDVVSDEAKTVKIRIDGPNAWPYFYHEGGKHTFVNISVPRASMVSREVYNIVTPEKDTAPLPSRIKPFTEMQADYSSLTNLKKIRVYNMQRKQFATDADGLIGFLTGSFTVTNTGSATLSTREVAGFTNVLKRYSYIYWSNMLADMQPDLSSFLAISVETAPVENGQNPTSMASPSEDRELKE